jgi:teichuronic acid biosynthesis glycosyltransferase TuaH
MVSTIKKVVWFGEIKWDYLTTRKQQILSRWPKDYEILYIEPYVVGKKQHWLPRRRANITVLTIPFIKNIPPSSRLSIVQDQNLVRWLMAILGSIYFQLWAILLGFSGKDRWIGLSSVHWGKVAARLEASLHFYDANDAHLDFPGTPTWLKAYLTAYLKQANVSFAVSPEIEKRIKQLGARDVRLLGNGVDFEHFSTVQDIPQILAGITKPILGYAGAMDWLDSQLIRSICISYPHHEIILVGPEIRPGWFSSQLEFQGLGNLRYLGRVPYSDLPGYVQQFTVALIPFVVDELTRPLNPNKLYEYSAAGKPVVSMNYSSTIETLSDLIFVADSHAAFGSAIGKALKKPIDERRLQLARDNSWDQVSKSMLTALESL